MENVYVHRLTKSSDPAINEQLIRNQHPPLKAIRLKTLKANPEAFLSKYENEVNMPLEKWLDRLRPSHVQHFVAIVSEELVNEKTEITEATAVVGYLVVLMEEKPKLDDGSLLRTYYFAAFAVDPEYQGKGVGSRVIREAMRWAQEDAKEAGFKRIRFRLAWMDGNERACRLYTRLGFVRDSALAPEEKECDHENAMALIVDL